MIKENSALRQAAENRHLLQSTHDHSHKLRVVGENVAEITGLFVVHELDSPPILELLNDIRKNKGVALFAVIDVNDLKKLNDEFGHTEVDFGLAGLASRIKVRLLDNDLHFVLFQPQAGGDEFIVIAWMIPEDDETENKILTKIATAFRGEEKNIHLAQRKLAASIERPASIALPGGDLVLHSYVGIAAHAFENEDQKQMIDDVNSNENKRELAALIERLRADAAKQLEGKKNKRLKDKIKAMRRIAKTSSLSEFEEACIALLREGRVNEELQRSYNKLHVKLAVDAYKKRMGIS